ncbi:MAG: hypothetical protein ACLP9L_33775 [Thermoguttaceae bacterium]
MISYFGIMALVALLFVFVSGLANPRTRRFVIGLVAFLGLAVLFFGFVSVPHAVQVRQQAKSNAQFQQEQARWMAKAEKQPAQWMAKAEKQLTQMQAQVEKQQAQMMAQVQNRVPMIASAPVPSPPMSSASKANRPKMSVIAVLGHAIIQAWMDSYSAPVAEAPETPAKTSQAVAPPKTEPPSWVNAPPKMEDNCYKMSVRAGPYTTPLECERELRKSLQGAVAEYAELSFGPEAAAVRLPDDALQHLVHDRWTEVRPMEIDGSSQNMFSLHALVVFDPPVQQQIKTEVQQIQSEAQRFMIDQRVQGAAVVFGGVLGLLGLTWGGLRWVTRREQGVVERSSRVGRA